MKKRTHLTSTSLLFFISGLFLLGTLALSCSSKIKKTDVIIYLVRHAEKDLTDPTDNPPLTTEGEARALELVNELDKVSLEAIYSTEYQRNINTVKPLSIEKGIDIQNYVANDWEPMLDQIKDMKGKAFLICGHGDNLLPMIDYFGLDRPIDELGHLEYDKLFKIQLSDDTSIIEMKSY